MSDKFNEQNKEFSLGAKIKDCGFVPNINSYDAVEEKTNHDLMDYSKCIPSEDQQAINHYLRKHDLKGKEVLHLGIGNSSIAKMFSHAKSIDGITISKNEKSYADSLMLANYHVTLANKYSEHFHAIVKNRKYDLIVDNNLASFTCCEKHFLIFMNSIMDCLEESGALITHWLGMQWILDHGINNTEECWRLNREKLAYIAANYNMSLKEVGDIYILKKKPTSLQQ